ncbi:hypothetical protein DFJ74DRAFT_733233 [Hyaloraphidium curvatum]|nr:hypothetical protein DFJ74DRAFT_733233 [Hyaloraphidium curvatum]
MDQLDDYGIVDAHHHLWVAKDPRRPNFTELMQTGQLNNFGSMEHNNRDYLVADILKDYSDAGVKLECTVYLECGWLEGGPVKQANETLWVHENATVPSGGVVARAIVGHINLMRGEKEFEACIAEHFKASPAFRGLRYSATHDPSGKFFNSHRDANVFENPRFLKCMPLFEKYDISLELWSYSHQLSYAAALARKFPKVRMVLDHFGGPLDIADDPAKFAAWSKGMEELARCPLVFAKLSGLMAHLGLGYHKLPGGADRWTIANGTFGKLIEHTVRTFGVDRCIWASNFPVDKANGGVGEIVRANMIVFRRMGLSYEDRKKLFRDNALKFYRISPVQGKL